MTQFISSNLAEVADVSGQVDQEKQNATVNSAPSYLKIGSVITPVTVGSYNNVSGKIVTPLADGKILVVGQGGDDYAFGNVVLTRYNSNGSLDTTFSDDGIAISSLGHAVVQSVSVQPDGRVDVVARSTESNNSLNFALLSYNTDGSLVAGSTTGSFLIAANVGTTAATDFALRRYTSNNTLDNSFGTNGGVVTTIATFDTPTYVTTQADGKIVLVGSASDATTGDFALLRYNSDGSLDSGFATDGTVSTDFNGSNDYIRNAVVQTDGKIVAVGSSGSTTTGYNIAVARYNSDGSLDSSFSGDGKFTYSFGANMDFGESVTVQADGKILIAGEAKMSSIGSYDFVVLRLNADGTVDTDFGNNGQVISPVTAKDDLAYDITLQADGKILVTGGSNIDASGKNSSLTLFRYNSDGSLDSSFAPVNTLDGNPTYILGGSPVVMDSNVRIRDTELDLANNYAGASITLGREVGSNIQVDFTRSGSLALDHGLVIVDGVPVGEYSPSKISFNSNATSSRVNSVLQQLAYSSKDTGTSEVPISWIFNDGKVDTVGTVNITTVAGTDDTYITVANPKGDTKTGTDKNDTITGNKGKDVLSGGSGNDSLYGLAGNDRLNGNDGDDYLDGGLGKNTLVGGAGNDTYVVSTKSNKVIETKDNGTDLVISNISMALAANLENLTLTGSAKLNGSGNTLANMIYGNDANNTLEGKVGNDNLHGGGGNDKLSGGAGIDFLFGEAGNDRLSGGGDSDYLIGGEGNDILSGGLAGDILLGGEGKDRLSGGGGADRFSFNTATETGVTKASWDVITDFVSKQGDKIDLSAIDANTSTSENEAFTYIGNSAFSADATGQLRFDAKTHVLYGSTDADTDAEFAIQLLGVKSLLAGDFYLRV